MSNLPKMKQEVSENPHKNSVTAPSDPREQEKDVDRKMRLYGVFEAMRNGNLPSNAQIEGALDRFVNTAPFDTSKLSQEGQDLIEAFRGVVMDAKKLILAKNQDELIQNFVWNASNVDTEAHKDSLKSISSPTDKDTAKSEGKEALQNLKTIAQLILTNSEVRKLLSDISVLGRDVAADAAAKVADKARPDEEQLQQAEKPAPDAQWIGPDGSKRGPNDPVPDTGVGAKVDQAKEAKNQAQNQAQNFAQDEANKAQNRAQNTSTNDPNAQANIAKDQASGAAQRAKGALNEQLPTEQAGKLKENAKQQYQENKEDTKQYFKDKFPEERRDRFIHRLKKVVAEQQQHEDYQDAVSFFLDMAHKYKRHAENVADQGQKEVSIRSDPAYQNAEMELRVILERFANNQSMQPILDAVDQLYADADNDPELRKWWSSANRYIRRVLLEEGYVLTDECTEEGNKLNDSGKHFWNERYRGHREALLDAIEDFFYAYNEDPLNKKLGNSVKKLIKDLATDDAGNLQYKPHIISDLRHVIIPAVAKRIGYVPIPRLEYVDKSIELVLENLTVQTSNILPNKITIEARNYFELSPFDALGDVSQHAFTIGFSQIQADIRDIGFYARKRSGFPKMQDSGLADVIIGGEGICGKIGLETTPNQASIFRVKTVDIEIHDLRWKVRDSKHNWLYNSLRTAASGLIRKGIAAAVEKAIRDALNQLDQQLTDIRDAANEGKRRDDTTRTEMVKQRIQQKKEAAQAKSEKAKAKKDERQAEFNIVTSRDQEKVNWESPNSYVGKQGAVAKAANSGSGWKSPAFDIWKASPARHEGIVNQNLKEY